MSEEQHLSGSSFFQAFVSRGWLEAALASVVQAAGDYAVCWDQVRGQFRLLCTRRPHGGEDVHEVARPTAATILRTMQAEPGFRASRAWGGNRAGAGANVKRC